MEVTDRRRTAPHRREPQHASNHQEGPQRYLVADHQTVASAMLDCWLVTWLKDSALGLWLRERVTELRDCRVVNWVVSWLSSSRQTTLLLLVLQAVLWLLLLWVLSELHLGLPCFLLALLYWIYDEPVRRAVDQVWAHRSEGRPVRGEQVES